tara:strand:+ start:132299 stop:133069 length:771 start_codon:yes stop_codon:yes gene_type:complete
MKPQLTSKLELNLFNERTSADFVCDFAIKHRIPVIVALPEFIPQLLTRRMIRSGQFKIIAAIDFPKGANFAMDKIYRSNVDFAAADGFEILLSPGRTQIETRNEMKTIYEFIKMNNALLEVRWCVNGATTTEEELEGILKNMKVFPPSHLRIDSNLASPQIDLEKQTRLAEIVSDNVPFPIKVSGNVNLETMLALQGSKNVRRFDVSLKQAESLVREINKEVSEKGRDAFKLPRNLEDRAKDDKPVQSGSVEPKFV